MSHPADSPEFNAESHEPVFYLSHPLAPDESYTFQQNMDHVLHMMRLCFDEGFRVIAPYHGICLCLDDRTTEHRRIGLETDCTVAYKLGRIIMTGHRRSMGMELELGRVYDYISDWQLLDQIDGRFPGAQYNTRIIDLVAMSDGEARLMLRAIKNG